MKKHILVFLLFCAFSHNLYSQATTAPGNTWGGALNEYLGWDNTSVTSLRIKHALNYPINFYTQAGNTTFNNQRMTIYEDPTNATAFNAGYVGIGIATPTYKLDVDGDINAGGIPTTTTNSYRLGTNKFLWHNGIPTNIYAGVNAGNTNTGNNNNTFVGYLTGNAITTGFCNTLIGSNAGQAITTSRWNVCIGYNAGNSLTTLDGVDNTFVGHDAGLNTTGGGPQTSNGSHNSFFGDEAGQQNTYGNYNTAAGAYSFHNNTLGDSNVCFGYAAGSANITGTNNLFLGAQSGCASTATGLNNASAIGFGAIVNNSDQMILGGDYTHYGLHHSTFVGIGLSGSLNLGYGPRNSLEINADPFRSSNTATGLRFTQVTQSSSNNTFTQPFNKTTISAWGKVLTVDINGDVGLTDDQGGGGSLNTADNGLSLNAPSNVQLGQLLGSGTVAQLIQPTEIPMNNYNLVFSDPSNRDAKENSIGLGIIVPAAKLHVKRTPSSINLIPIPTAVLIENSDLDMGIPNNGFGIGLSVIAFNNNSNNISIKSDVYDARTNYAGYYTAIKTAGSNFGGYFEASKATSNFAVYGNAPIAPPIVGGVYTGFNVAIYGTAPTHPIGQIPVPNLGTYAGYFNGDIGYSGGIYFISDSTLKTSIQPLTQATYLLSQMNAHTFYFDTTKYKDFLNVPKSMQYGMLAQEIEAIAPTLIQNTVLPPNMDSLGNMLTPPVPVKMMNYMGIIPILVEGFKEQQKTIDSLNTRMNSLEILLNSCCSMAPQGSNGNRPTTHASLEDQSTGILYQNKPNPFNDKTIIRYYIPESSIQSSLVFYNSSGDKLKEVTLSNKSDGAVELDAGNLSDGIYSYSLLIDGKLIDSKRMIKTK